MSNAKVEANKEEISPSYVNGKYWQTDLYCIALGMRR
jgi:hypothetical protein